MYACNDGGLAFRVNEGGINYLYAAAPGNEGGYLQRVDLETGDVITVFTHCQGMRIGNPNFAS